jgi:hypothetical protein
MARFPLVLAVLSLAAMASPARAQTPDIQEDIVSYQLTPSLRASMIREAALTRAKLARPVNFDGIANPKTSLWDALQSLTKCSDISLGINAAAFRDEGIKDVFSQPIARPIPPLRGIPASRVLSIILGRMPSRSGVTLSPRGRSVEVSTARAYLYEMRLNGAIVDPITPLLPRR